MAFSVPVFSLPGQIEQQMFQFPINEGQSFCKVVAFVYVVYGPSVFVNFLQILLNVKNNIPLFWKKLR